MIAGTAPASAQPAVSLYVAVRWIGRLHLATKCLRFDPDRHQHCRGWLLQRGRRDHQRGRGDLHRERHHRGASFNSLTIAGAGASTTTVNGNQAGSVFTINGGTVTIDDLTITNGLSAGGYGDGIDITGGAGPVTVTDSTLSDNGSPGGGWGGGIYNFDDTVNVTGSTFTNDNRYYGGAINNNGGTMTVTDSTFSGNSSSAGGSDRQRCHIARDRQHLLGQQRPSDQQRLQRQSNLVRQHPVEQ